MNKTIKLTQSQVEAQQNGASMFVLPIRLIDNKIEYKMTVKKNVVHGLFDDGAIIKKIKQPMKDFIKHESSLQVGDRDVGIEKQLTSCFDCELCNDSHYCEFTDTIVHYDSFEDCDFSTKKIDSINEILDVRVIRVQDLIKKLDTKNKKALEKFTYHCTTEPIAQKRIRAVKEYFSRIIKELNLDIKYEDNPYIFLIS